MYIICCSGLIINRGPVQCIDSLVTKTIINKKMTQINHNDIYQ